MTKKKLRYELRSLWPDAYLDNGLLLGFTLVGGLAPLYLAWGVRAVHAWSLPKIAEFGFGGEFALYSAAMVAPAAFLLGHDRKKNPFPGRPAFLLGALVLWLAAIWGYMVVAPDVLSGGKPGLANPEGYSWLTLGLFAVSTVFFYVISILDATRTIQDIRKIEDAQVDDLTRRINDLPS